MYAVPVLIKEVSCLIVHCAVETLQSKEGERTFSEEDRSAA